MRQLSVFFAAAMGSASLAAPVTAHEFLIYFPSGDAVLRERGLYVAADAAAYFHRRGCRSASVLSATDTVGPATVNRRLSRRRAEAVASVLQRLGVPADAVRLNPRGEDHAAVATPDEVAEPLNRLAVIELNCA